MQHRVAQLCACSLDSKISHCPAGTWHAKGQGVRAGRGRKPAKWRLEHTNATGIGQQAGEAGKRFARALDNRLRTTQAAPQSRRIRHRMHAAVLPPAPSECHPSLQVARADAAAPSAPRRRCRRDQNDRCQAWRNVVQAAVRSFDLANVGGRTFSPGQELACKGSFDPPGACAVQQSTFGLCARGYFALAAALRLARPARAPRAQPPRSAGVHSLPRSSKAAIQLHSRNRLRRSAL